MLLALLACSTEVDTATCEPPYSWDGWASGFFTSQCASCHLGTDGIPVIDFRALDAVLEHEEGVRRRVLEQGDMPPGGGVSPQELERLEAFLDCPPAVGEGPSEAVVEPEWTAEDVEFALSAAPDHPLPDPSAFREAYLGLLALGDASCPGPDDDLGPPEVSLQGCTSASGVTFAGVSTFEDGPSAPGETRFELLNGDFRIDDFQVGGRVRHHTIQDSGGFHGNLVVEGTFVWPQAEDPWLAGGGGHVMDAVVERSDGATTVTLDASLRLGWPMRFNGLILDSCGATGTARVRGPEGLWYTAELDCGCGPVEVLDQDLGSVCVSLDGLRQALRDQVAP